MAFKVVSTPLVPIIQGGGGLIGEESDLLLDGLLSRDPDAEDSQFSYR